MQIKTQNDYPCYNVNYLTPEVLQAFKLFFVIHDINKSIDSLCNFIRRNNLYITIEELKSARLGTTSVLPDLATLNHLRSILTFVQNPIIVKTPKQSIFSFDGVELEFQNDLLHKFSLKRVDKIVSTFAYKNDELMYSKTNTDMLTSRTVIKYFSTNEDVSTCWTYYNKHRKNKLSKYVKGTDKLVETIDSYALKFSYHPENGFCSKDMNNQYHWECNDNYHLCSIVKDSGNIPFFRIDFDENQNGTKITYYNKEGVHDDSCCVYQYKEGLYKYLSAAKKLKKNSTTTGIVYFALHAYEDQEEDQKEQQEQLQYMPIKL